MTKTLSNKKLSLSPQSPSPLSTARGSENSSIELVENNLIIETEFRSYLHKLFKDLALRSSVHSGTGIDANTFIAYTGLSGLIGERFYDVARGGQDKVDLDHFTEIMVSTFSQNSQI